MILTIVLAPGVVAEPTTACLILERACAARGVSPRIVFTSTAEELEAALAEAAATGEFVFAPADPRDLAELHPTLASVVRVDLTDRGTDRSPGIRSHIRGRGIDGLRFAVDSWYFHRLHPGIRIPYGTEPDRFGDLRLPDNHDAAALTPVAVLVHGGGWHSRWESDLMDAMAIDLSTRGYATWNIEYRRPDDSSWQHMTADAAAAIAALVPLADANGLDLDRVVLVGHSAGGQMVLRLAADLAADPAASVRPAFTVSLAGVLDLEESDRRWLGEGSAATAIGGRFAGHPSVYTESSPRHRLPLGAPHAIVFGLQDSLDLRDISRRYVAAAALAGDEVTALEGPGGHFDVIDPRSAIWTDIVDLITPYTHRPVDSVVPRTKQPA